MHRFSTPRYGLRPRRPVTAPTPPEGPRCIQSNIKDAASSPRRPGTVHGIGRKGLQGPRVDGSARSTGSAQEAPWLLLGPNRPPHSRAAGEPPAPYLAVEYTMP